MIDKTRKWHDDCLKGIVGPRYEMEPAEGEYRCRRKDKSVYAVYFWYDRTAKDAPLRCHIEGKNVSEETALRTWEYCGAKNCITPENYWSYIDHGRWLDNDEVAVALSNGPEMDPGANGQNAEESLKLEIAKAVKGAAAYQTIDSDEQAAKAQTLRSALTTFKGDAQKKYESWSRPLLDEIETIRKTWFPIRDAAAEAADGIRKAMGRWEDVKRENARRIAEDAAKIEREQADAFRDATDRAIAANEPPPEPPKPVPVVASNTPPPSTKIKGASGRAASVQLKKIVTAIDIDKAFAQFRDDPELYAFLLDMAQKVVNSGFVAVGATIEEKSDIR